MFESKKYPWYFEVKKNCFIKKKKNDHQDKQTP